MKSLGFSLHSNILFPGRDNLTFSFPLCVPFISLSCLLLWLRFPVQYWMRVARKGIPVLLVPGHNGNTFSFSLFSRTLSVGLLYCDIVPLHWFVQGSHFEGMWDFIKSHDCYPSFCQCAPIRSLICICWTILASLHKSSLITVNGIFDVILNSKKKNYTCLCDHSSSVSLA
jgi:hypothetical protein